MVSILLGVIRLHTTIYVELPTQAAFDGCTASIAAQGSSQLPTIIGISWLFSRCLLYRWNVEGGRLLAAAPLILPGPSPVPYHSDTHILTINDCKVSSSTHRINSSSWIHAHIDPYAVAGQASE